MIKMMPTISVGLMAEWSLYKIAQLGLLTEVEVYRILKDKLAWASTLAVVPCSRQNTRRYRVANINDPYEGVVRESQIENPRRLKSNYEPAN